MDVSNDKYLADWSSIKIYSLGPPLIARKAITSLQIFQSVQVAWNYKKSPPSFDKPGLKLVRVCGIIAPDIELW